MQKITTILVLAGISVFGVACNSNKTAQNDPYGSSQPVGGSQDPYAATGEYDNVYASGGGQSYGGASTNSYGSDDYYSSASSDPYTPPSGGGSSAGTSQPSGGSTHTVEKGDTLYNISRRYGTSVGAIQSANGLGGDLIILGQQLQIP